MNPITTHYVHIAALLISLFVVSLICSKAMIMYNICKDFFLCLLLGLGMITMMIAGGFFAILLIVAVLQGVPA